MGGTAYIQRRNDPDRLELSESDLENYPVIQTPDGRRWSYSNGQWVTKGPLAKVGDWRNQLPWQTGAALSHVEITRPQEFMTKVVVLQGTRVVQHVFTPEVWFQALSQKAVIGEVLRLMNQALGRAREKEAETDDSTG